MFSTTSGKSLIMLYRKNTIFTTVQNLIFVLENDWAEFCTRDKFPAFEWSVLSLFHTHTQANARVKYDKVRSSCWNKMCIARFSLQTTQTRNNNNKKTTWKHEQDLWRDKKKQDVIRGSSGKQNSAYNVAWKSGPFLCTRSTIRTRGNNGNEFKLCKNLIQLSFHLRSIIPQILLFYKPKS